MYWKKCQPLVTLSFIPITILLPVKWTGLQPSRSPAIKNQGSSRCSLKSRPIGGGGNNEGGGGDPLRPVGGRGGGHGGEMGGGDGDDP